MSDNATRRLRKRQFVFLAVSTALFVLLIFVARGILLPFLLALFIAYLIEPVVKLFTRVRVGRATVPRWVAIVVVYVFFLASLVLFATQFFPLVVNEFGKLIPETKTFLNKLKTAEVPAWNKRIQEFIRANFPRTEDEPPVDATKSEREALPWAEEWMRAAATARDEALKQPLAIDPAALKAREAAVAKAPEEGAAFLVTPAKDGWAIRFRELSFEIKKSGDDSLLITPRDADKPIRRPKQREFDLERTVEKGIHELVEKATEHVGDYIAFGQRVVTGVVDAVVGIVITLMIAAFISIGATRLHGFFRSLAPSGFGGDYDKVVKQLDSGLSGVVRGQIVICLMNGGLTGLGLFGVAVVYGEPVKFAGILTILATVMSLIPIFGMIISGVPAVLLALTQSPYLAVFVAVWICVIHFIEANVLEPRIIGKHAKIHPVVVIFALLAGAHLYGAVGALLGVPIASMIQTFYLFVKERVYSGDEGS